MESPLPKEYFLEAGADKIITLYQDAGGVQLRDLRKLEELRELGESSEVAVAGEGR